MYLERLEFELEQLMKWAAFKLSAAIAFLFAEQKLRTSPIIINKSSIIGNEIQWILEWYKKYCQKIPHTWVDLRDTLSLNRVEPSVFTIIDSKCPVVQTVNKVGWPRSARHGVLTIWQTNTAWQSFRAWLARTIGGWTQILMVFAYNRTCATVVELSILGN